MQALPVSCNYAALPYPHADRSILLEHARFVYNLQEGDTHSEDSDDTDNYRWDSDDSLVSSSRRRRHAPKPHRKRMSILTNQYFDIPSYENGFEYSIPGKPDSQRRFFQSVARWDARTQMVVIPRRDVLPSPGHYSRSSNLIRRPTLGKPGYLEDYIVNVDIGIEKDITDEEDETTDVPETESGGDDEMSLE